MQYALQDFLERFKSLPVCANTFFKNGLQSRIKTNRADKRICKSSLRFRDSPNTVIAPSTHRTNPTITITRSRCALINTLDTVATATEDSIVDHILWDYTGLTLEASTRCHASTIPTRYRKTI